MRNLLDSHIFLWWISDDARLPARVRRVVSSAHNDCWVSHVTVWEMAIKAALGKLKLHRPVEQFVTEECEVNGFRLLPIAFRHVCAVERLPWHHRDPFDRLLVCQALAEVMALATRDPQLERYGVRVI